MDRGIDPACPHCGSLRVVRLARTTPMNALFDKVEIGRRVIEGRDERQGPFMLCQDCGKQFSVTKPRR